MTTADDPLAALAARLEADGFERDARPPERGPSVDQLVTLADGTLRLALVRDRGEWSVEVGHVAWDEGYDPDIWRAALEGTDPMDPSPLADQAAYVHDRLDALRAAAVDPALRDRLDEIATARAELWFG